MTSEASAPTKPTAGLRALLHRVYGQADATFSGLGVIVWDGVSTIPIRPMRSEPPSAIHCSTTIEVLVSISHEASPFHDGFHVVDAALALVQLSVYFSPSISPQVETPANGQMFGGRYLAAAFGSCLEGVLCTGVVSRQYGPIVFEQGREV
jgi:DNA integrity scanning protein DisA with diadenylate cyclase activity